MGYCRMFNYYHLKLITKYIILHLCKQNINKITMFPIKIASSVNLKQVFLSLIFNIKNKFDWN